jgi:hypothetical protein
MQGTYVSSDGTKIGILWWWLRWWRCRYDKSIAKVKGEGTLAPDQHRHGKEGHVTIVSQQK